MIISASYKTDIPTFYGDWFMRRLRAGFCKMLNPYNRSIYRVSLAREDVDGFVFWTKNAGPFMSALREVHRLRFPFTLQYTINGYPRELEAAVTDYNHSVDTFRRVADEFGPAAAVWRYDPILFSSLTPPQHHLRSFSSLARALEGVADEVVVSFAQFYRKTKRNLTIAAQEQRFEFDDPADDVKRELLSKLVEIAHAHRMRLSICSQRALLVAGAGEARCVDARRLEACGATAITAPVAGNRPDCECFQSGPPSSDTCPHGCVYCYSVQNRPLAQERFRRHGPDSEFLFDPPLGAREVKPRQGVLALPVITRKP
jgi:hypothetical protein